MRDTLSELFLPEAELIEISDLLRTKRNLVLQGPPGVGKTFVAKRLAFLLMGRRDTSRIETVQFHQSYSYEDFVQGYRPTEAGGFKRKDGLFVRFCRQAAAGAGPAVFVIDEINRGNLSKILGELMLLIELDTRGPEWAVSLAYAQDGEARFSVPENVHLIGTMNTADRSLALVGHAPVSVRLRRSISSIRKSAVPTVSGCPRRRTGPR
jgi:5-methylcytosine-specific restriction endonuclease McrBC GTP-binding regulatory subunit McrB